MSCRTPACFSGTIAIALVLTRSRAVWICCADRRALLHCLRSEAAVSARPIQLTDEDSRGPTCASTQARSSQGCAGHDVCSVRCAALRLMHLQALYGSHLAWLTLQCTPLLTCEGELSCFSRRHLPGTARGPACRPAQSQWTAHGPTAPRRSPAGAGQRLVADRTASSIEPGGSLRRGSSAQPPAAGSNVRRPGHQTRRVSRGLQSCCTAAESLTRVAHALATARQMGDSRRTSVPAGTSAAACRAWPSPGTLETRSGTSSAAAAGQLASAGGAGSAGSQTSCRRCTRCCTSLQGGSRRWAARAWWRACGRLPSARRTPASRRQAFAKELLVLATCSQSALAASSCPCSSILRLCSKMCVQDLHHHLREKAQCPCNEGLVSALPLGCPLQGCVQGVLARLPLLGSGVL